MCKIRLRKGGGKKSSIKKRRILFWRPHHTLSQSQNVVLIKFGKKFLSNRRGIRVAYFRVQRPDYRGRSRPDNGAELLSMPGRGKGLLCLQYEQVRVVEIFSLAYSFSFLSPPLWETARYRLNYCLKEPLNQKNNQLKQRTDCQFFGYRWMDDLRFYVFFKVFQSYRDDGKLIMKGCVQWNYSYG